MKIVNTEIKLSDGYTLCVENYDVGDSSEFTIYIKDAEGMVNQDICLVRPHRKDDGSTDEESIDCIVWSDHNAEDYTHKFVVSVWREDKSIV